MTSTNARALLDSLQKEKRLLITPQGFSMWPLITGKRDSVWLEQCAHSLGKGDVALFLNNDDIFFLHRVIRVGANSYDFRGDGQLQCELNIPAERVYAVMKGVCRKNKYIDISSRGYRLYSALWCHPPLIWFRMPLLRIGKLICRKRASSRKK